MPMNHLPLRYASDEGHTDVSYFEDGEKFATCGTDGDVRIWSTNDIDDPIHYCVGEWALAVRQKGEKLYVATNNNDIQILALPEGERDGVLDRYVAPINHIAVAKEKQLIALAGEDMEVKLINLEKETKEVTVFDCLDGPCLSVAISPNSLMLAASSGDGKLRIWNLENKSLLKEITCFPKTNSFANAKLLCRLDFEPKRGKRLAYPDKNSIIVLNVDTWSQELCLTCSDVSASFSIVQYSPCGNYILASSEEGDFVIWTVDSAEVYNTSKHEKPVAICGLMWNPKGNGEIVYTDIEGQLGVITDAIQVEANETESVEVDAFKDVDFGNVQFDEDEDNENVISVEKLKRDILGTPEPELANLSPGTSRASTPRPRTPVIPLQDAFMPSSTPEHLDPRYLCWNDVGIIRCYGNNADDDSTSKSIEVEFHDSTFHNSMMIQNYQDYTMGSVSKAALAVANCSQINIIPLASSSKEWSLKMEEDEEIVLIATSETLICFAMSNYIVRVCSVYGTQRAVVCIPGPFVSMSAYKNILMVAYHEGGIREGNQSINIRQIEFNGTSVCSKDISSALGPKGHLRWLGFSDVGTPAMMDSLGMLSLYPQNCNTWIPFCDTKKNNKSFADNFFVTTVFESYQAIGGIKCKGTLYPGFTPRPTMCEILLEPPFAEPGTEKTQMEMNLFTWSNLKILDTDKKFKETALKTFALACKNNLDERALEFMEILANPQLITLSMKYASKLERRRLVEKLVDLAQKISDETNDEDLGVKVLETPEPPIRPVLKKLSLSAAKSTSRVRNLKENEIKASPNLNNSTHDGDTVATPPLNSFNQSTNQSVNDTQGSLFTPEEKPNPFLKSSKKNKVDGSSNLLSLTDKFAGVSYEKENKNKNAETPANEKRKLSDPDSEKQKSKQRKLDSFRFAKKPK